MRIKTFVHSYYNDVTLHLQIKGNLVTIFPKVKNTKKLHDKFKTDYEQKTRKGLSHHPAIITRWFSLVVMFSGAARLAQPCSCRPVFYSVVVYNRIFFSINSSDSKIDRKNV